jgi:hypothetical protein
VPGTWLFGSNAACSIDQIVIVEQNPAIRPTVSENSSLDIGVPASVVVGTGCASLTIGSLLSSHRGQPGVTNSW